MTAAAMAAFESRAGAALIRRLANASCDFGAGLVIEGVLDQDLPTAEPLGGMLAMARDITLQILRTDLAGRELARGDSVLIDGTEYQLREPPIEHRAHGTLQLLLEEPHQ